MCKNLPRRAALLAVASLSVACARVPPAPAGIPASASGIPRNGLEVIGAMRRAHPSRALRSLALRVSTIDARDTTRVRRAQLYASLPGRVRMESLPTTLRTGFVRQRQHLAVFERGAAVSRTTRVDLATLIAYDIFAQSIDTTIMWLDSARVRFALLRLDELDGRRAWVVGALAGDTTSSQFWVDAVEWRVVRVIQREPWNGNQLVDTRFTEFMQVRDVPVPRRVLVYRGGRLTQRQEFQLSRVNPRVPSGAFDLARWRSMD
jgi:hypothetical protein